MQRKWIVLGSATIVLLAAAVASAWTGPTATAPGGNVAAPINVSSASQVKNGNLGVNGLAVYGNSLISPLTGTGGYLNFDYTAGGTSGTGSSGYGVRDNAGTLEFKNLGGSWASLQSTITTLVGSSTGYWLGGTGGIYYNGGSVAIGTSNVSFPLVVSAGTDHVLNVRGDPASWGGGLPSGLLGPILQSVNSAENVQEPMTFEASNINLMGKVGIGTASPAYALTLNGAPNSWAEVVNWGPGSVAGSYGIIVGSSATGYSQFQNASGYYALLADSTWGLYTNGYVGGAAFYYISDARLKKNVQTIASSTALSDILALRPVTFNWIDPKQSTTTQIGFIAQEVEKVTPSLVSTDASTTIKTVDYARTTPLLVGSVQALEQQIQDQQKEIDDLKAEIDSLKQGR
ncbi:MAG TPA: tail fiber domain-containing protein [Candidatus Paceibacterota bacterium]|nr:tail fiber domain-containing protein [Candidatus Paceibacterota bacterium]